MFGKLLIRQTTSLGGAVAVITGAGGGIGRELALALAIDGCHLALVDNNAAALTETALAAKRYPVNVSQHVVDVTSQDQMAAVAASIADIHGVIDILINNAGITLQKSFTAHSVADLHRIVGVNLWGVLYGCHYFLPYLRKSMRAHIVNLSSMAAFIGMPSQSTYWQPKPPCGRLVKRFGLNLRVRILQLPACTRAPSFTLSSGFLNPRCVNATRSAR